MANYTEQYINYFHSYLPNLDPSMEHIMFGGGFRNGDTPPEVYSRYLTQRRCILFVILM